MTFRKILIAGVVIVLIIGLGLVAYRVISGRSLGISQIGTRLKAIIGPVLAHNDVIPLNKTGFKNIIFIHHSVGNNLIHQGNLREQFQQIGYDFWDQDYS